MLSDNAGAGPARHADRVEQTAGASNAPSGGPRLLRIPLLRPAAGCAAHFGEPFWRRWSEHGLNTIPAIFLQLMYAEFLEPDEL